MVVALVAVATIAFIGNVVAFTPEMNYCTSANLYAMMSHELHFSENNAEIRLVISLTFVCNRQLVNSNEKFCKHFFHYCLSGNAIFPV